jgi:permuted papain-like amidase YaeF/Yiix C92 family enzyme
LTLGTQRTKPGFNKVGYVTENGVVIYPRRSRIAKESLNAIKRRPHRIIQLAGHPRAKEIETFFTSNIINTAMFVAGIQMMGQPASPFWDSPIKLPVLSPITPAEHEKRWNTVLPTLQRGDSVFTLDTKSIVSRLITYLDQGTWSHVGTYAGEGRVIEAITSGVTERSIQAYHHPRYRLGVYRHGGSAEQIEKMIELARSELGKPYAFKKVLRLGIRMILGMWPDPIETRQVTPNRIIAFWPFRLVAVI